VGAVVGVHPGDQGGAAGGQTVVEGGYQARMGLGEHPQAAVFGLMLVIFGRDRKAL